MNVKHNVKDLIQLFNQLFQATEATILAGGGAEPLYIPKDEHYPWHRIIFRHDYYASALHEIAHWCIAGEQRRQLPDYGYWYEPDGRNAEQQQLFERVETKPQALEWIFSEAANALFHFSADNFSANNVSDCFKQQVMRQKEIYLQQGLPRRAALFQKTLLDFYVQVTAKIT